MAVTVRCEASESPPRTARTVRPSRGRRWFWGWDRVRRGVRGLSCPHERCRRDGSSRHRASVRRRHQGRWRRRAARRAIPRVRIGSGRQGVSRRSGDRDPDERAVVVPAREREWDGHPGRRRRGASVLDYWVEAQRYSRWLAGQQHARPMPIVRGLERERSSRRCSIWSCSVRRSSCNFWTLSVLSARSLTTASGAPLARRYGIDPEPSICQWPARAGADRI